MCNQQQCVNCNFCNFVNKVFKVKVFKYVGDAKKCVVSKFHTISPEQARVTSLHIIMTYVNDE
jgi:hypothetical protein